MLILDTMPVGSMRQKVLKKEMAVRAIEIDCGVIEPQLGGDAGGEEVPKIAFGLCPVVTDSVLAYCMSWNS